MKKIILLFIVVSCFFVVNLRFSYAADNLRLGELKGKVALSSDSIPVTIGKVITFGLGIVGSLAVLMLVIGGIMYIISGGDYGPKETAQGIITWAIIGLVVALLGWVIVNTVISNLGSESGSSSEESEELPPGQSNV